MTLCAHQRGTPERWGSAPGGEGAQWEPRFRQQTPQPPSLGLTKGSTHPSLRPPSRDHSSRTLGLLAPAQGPVAEKTSGLALEEGGAG